VKREFYQGMIQCAVALEHFRRGNPRGVICLHGTYRKHFSHVPTSFMGLDIDRFLRAMDSTLSPVLELQPPPNRGEIAFDPMTAPQLVLRSDPFAAAKSETTTMSSSIAVDSVVRWDGSTATIASDELAREEPLEIRVRGRAISVTMRTPDHDGELAAGFLLSEGLIHQTSDVLKIQPCDRNEEGNLIDVILAPEVHVDFAKLTRHVFASSSCGLCGKATIDAVRGKFAAIESDLSIPARLITGLPEIMRQTQAAFDRTGGLHAAAVFDHAGKLIVLREDVGRHNAVDKVLGFCLLHGLLPLRKHILLVSGRTSFEILQKALAGRVAIVAAVSAPSSLAVEFAAESGQTLIGFVRGQRMNVYTHPSRIRFEPSPLPDASHANTK
jgi:FdhD protein